jgi:ribose-phosphate pyrophosphokinase
MTSTLKTVVSPDAGRVRVAERWTDVLGSPLAIIHKRRDPNVPNQVKMFEVVGDVKDRICVVVDDMIDTGGTIATAAETLLEFGAAQVIVAATHGILSAPASERLNSAAISEVIVTDTLPISEDKRFPKLTILSIAPLLAEAVRAVFSEDSVTKLVEDQPMLFDK